MSFVFSKLHYWWFSILNILFPFWEPGIPLMDYAQNSVMILMAVVALFLCAISFSGAFSSGRNFKMNCVYVPTSCFVILCAVLGSQIGFNAVINWVDGHFLVVNPEKPVLVLATRPEMSLHSDKLGYVLQGTRADDHIQLSQFSQKVSFKPGLCDPYEPESGFLPSAEMATKGDSVSIAKVMLLTKEHKIRPFNARVFLANRPSGSMLTSDFEVYFPTYDSDCFQGYRMNYEQRGALFRSSLITLPSFSSRSPYPQ